MHSWSQLEREKIFGVKNIQGKVLGERRYQVFDDSTLGLPGRWKTFLGNTALEGHKACGGKKTIMEAKVR